MRHEKGMDYSWGDTWRGEGREEGKINPHLPYEINRQFQKLINQVGRHACFVISERKVNSK